MTTNEIRDMMAKRVVNQKARIVLEGLPVEVLVLDYRQVWNRLDALVASTLDPKTQKWVDATRLFNPIGNGR